MYTVLHAIVGYFFLLLTVRVLSRRPGAQMTPFEFVLIFLIGGVIILATVGDDHSMTNCFGAVITVALMHRTVSYLKARFPKFGAVVDGAPVILLQNGEWQVSSINQVRVDDTDVMASARSKNIKTLDQIKYAILERNGGITVIPKKK